MPLPTPNSAWPPKHLEPVARDVDIWAAWWGGSSDDLTRVYGGTWGGNNAVVESWQRHTWEQRGGLFGGIRRFFWGQPTRAGQQNTKLHIPLAAEIAQVSADLLFGQPPQITVDETKPDAVATQEAIDRLLGEGAHTLFHEAAESCAALGHTYLRVGWDLEIDSAAPILSTVDADAAYPLYQYGRLREVTFVREWSENNGVLRHFEFHEPGAIWHAVYLGTRDNVGRAVPLDAYPETADLVQDGMIADDRRAGAGIETGLDRLDVVGVSNARSRTWRHIPTGRDLGRSDVSGVEPEMDALDDVWSSWMRDVRHGRSRIHVPSHMLEARGGRGAGAIVDLDRELYVGLESPPDGQLQLTATQFKIRFQEHAETAAALVERIVSGAGYSPQTFGLDAVTALTATESWAQQIRTQNTRNAKVRRWRQALIQLTALMLDVDRAQFKGKGNPDMVPEVTFSETVSESQLARAQTAQALRTAEAASTETLVRMIHGDWDDDRVQAEVTEIRNDRGTAPDPIDMFRQGRLNNQPDPDDDEDPELDEAA